MQVERALTSANIDRVLNEYVASAEAVGDSIRGLTGLKLLDALKRGKAGTGPYPNVALFEAANRIMTDLVILYGVRWLLRNKVFPFQSYSVEYGHENNHDHDLRAEADGRLLIGEAFNVAQSFFGIKKNSAVKKLRASNAAADYRVILCNCEAVLDTYLPKPQEREYFVFVRTGSDTGGRVVPNHVQEPAARGPLAIETIE